MDTEEAIANVKSVYSEVTQDLDEVIRLLKRGEKFEKMWEEFKSHWGTYNFNESLGLISVKGITNDLEQKYFPKK